MSIAPRGQPDQSITLNRLELEMRKEDCVMEPGVLDTLTRYMRASGQPAQAIENLATNYLGALHSTLT